MDMNTDNSVMKHTFEGITAIYGYEYREHCYETPMRVRPLFMDRNTDNSVMKHTNEGTTCIHG